MITKRIQVLLENEEDQESLKRYENLKSYCKENKFTYYESSSYDGTISLIIEDKYNSEDMKSVIEYCKRNNLERGEFISKHSKNILDAYLKAIEEYKEKQTIYQNQYMTREKSNELHLLGQFINHLKNIIVQRVLKGYEEK